MEHAHRGDADHDHHDHGSRNSVALSATLHCLTGCAIGEILGVVIGTAIGLSNGATIVLAIALAFVFGYSLTSLPLLRAGLALSAVVPIAFASDTASIGLMELIDNAIILVIPGAMEAGLGDVLFWGTLSFALVVAGMFAFPLNRWLIDRGKGHAAVHETGIHGGPPTRVVAAVVVLMGIFGSAVLIAEVISGDDEMGHGAGMSEHEPSGHGEEGAEPDPVRGTTASAHGMTLKLNTRTLAAGEQAKLAFRIAGADGKPVRDFDVAHEKRMHLIVARRDLTGFVHLHPRLGPDGTWTTDVSLPTAGTWRAFADFKSGGSNMTLADDIEVTGEAHPRTLADPSPRSRTATGYDVVLSGQPRAGDEQELSFEISRNGKSVAVEPYLGAGGHLVALRSGDLAYLHVHPTGEAGGSRVSFATEFPNPGTYRLFLQFKHDGRVHTAAFTQRVSD